MTVYEKSDKLLQKVRISGGGRCNVTHACFSIDELIKFYPRGAKVLRGAFEKFSPADMISWLENEGVVLKTESDGRIFPASNSSLSIINCFCDLLEKNKVNIKYSSHISQIIFKDDQCITLFDSNGNIAHYDYVIVCGGSSASLWDMLGKVPLPIVSPVPSLFTFNSKDILFRELSGISIPEVRISIVDTKYIMIGPILITHWGLSGPAILKLSAMAARHLADLEYKFSIKINWINIREDEALPLLKEIKFRNGKKKIFSFNNQLLPLRLWKNILVKADIDEAKNWADMNKQELNLLARILCNTDIYIAGKSTNKDEFVTAGGVSLSAIDAKTMSVKIKPNLYMAGEVLDIDGYTGGFNFQAAWTTAWIAAQSIINKL